MFLYYFLQAMDALGILLRLCTVCAHWLLVLLIAQTLVCIISDGSATQASFRCFSEATEPPTSGSIHTVLQCVVCNPI